jgi:hypothetical protein
MKPGATAGKGRRHQVHRKVPGFKRMSVEAVGDDVLTTFLARRI